MTVQQKTTIVKQEEIYDRMKSGLVANYGDMSGCTFNISFKM
jgi:hypothetical protein